MRRIWHLMLACLLTMTLGACGQAPQSTGPSSEPQAQQGETAPAGETEASADGTEAEETVDYHDPGKGYRLEQVVVLSRHNIRAPLSTGGSALALATPHEWITWTSNPSELTLRGGALETMMGQYFREWFEAEGLIPENWQPEDGEVRFYANSKQRTIATAQYFSSGMLPIANVEIERHGEYDEMDPVFHPKITFLTESYEEAALAQIAEAGGAEGMAGIAAGLEKNYALLTDVLDYTESEGYRSGELTDLVTIDTEVTLALDEEPAMAGSLKTACSLADALVLQYYEAADDQEASFGHDLTLDEWADISRIKDYYGEVLFSAPLVATNVAHPLLEEIGAELDTKGRAFTFLCGHDSNVVSVLAALGAENYDLPNAVEQGAPIGCKLVIEKWADADGGQFARLRLLYQSADQLKNLTLLTDGEEPGAVELSLTGLEKNADGLYAYDDLRARVQEAADAYQGLEETYADVELAEAA